jgi:hypothetical protein
MNNGKHNEPPYPTVRPRKAKVAEKPFIAGKRQEVKDKPVHRMDASCRFENITPPIASEYLKKNNCNRSLRKSTIVRYARDMASDNWDTTHQGIAFDRKGNLMDGQHRLHAIILSGVTVRMHVTRGVDPRANNGVDQGINRSTIDILHYQGIHVDYLSVGMVRWMMYDIAKGRETVGMGTRAERIIFYKEHQEAISFVLSLFQKGQPLPRTRISSVLAAFGRAYYHTKNKMKLEHAAEIMITGYAGQDETERWLINLRNNLLYLKSIAGEVIRMEIFAKAERALYGYLNGLEVSKTLTPTVKELFPLPGEKITQPAPSNSEIEASEETPAEEPKPKKRLGRPKKGKEVDTLAD